MMEEIIGLSAMSSGFIIAAMSFAISQRYRKMSTPFVFLAAAFLSYGLAEAYWYVLDTESAEPYQTAVDILYFLYYSFAALHIITTLKALRVRPTMRTSSLVLGMTLLLIGAYSIASLSQDIDHDTLIYGGFFSMLAATLASLSLVAILKTYRTILTTPWMLIGVSILVASLTDVWYYAQENITGYEYWQFPLMDGLWMFTDILMIAGIVMHCKKI